MSEPHPNGRRRGATTLPSLREEVSETLERLSRLLVQRVPDPLSADESAHRLYSETTRIQDEVRFLGQVASGWSHVPEIELHDDEGAGFGSTVEVKEVNGGERESYTLMAGALLDIDAGQVSLASPLGQALLGARAGMVITVHTPQRRRTLEVLSVLTLRDRLQRGIAADGAEDAIGTRLAQADGRSNPLPAA